MHLRSLLPVAAAVALLTPAAASAATYKLVTATHTSSSVKNEQGYNGRSTASWKLAKPVKIGFQGTTAMAQVKTKGTYAVDITTTWPGRCAWSAPTGSQTYPELAPGDVRFMVMPTTPGKVRVAFMGARTTLSNGHLGTECTTGVSGEPSAIEMGTKDVSASTFKKKTVTVKMTGSTTENGIAYTWSTKLVLRLGGAAVNQPGGGRLGRNRL